MSAPYSWYWCPGCGPSVRCHCGATECAQWTNSDLANCDHHEARQASVDGLCPRWMRWKCNPRTGRPNRHLRKLLTFYRKVRRKHRQDRTAALGRNLYRKRDRSKVGWL